MTGAEYRKAITKLGMSQADAALILSVDDSTSHRWIANKHPIPESVALLLKVMIRKRIKPAEIFMLARAKV